MWNRRLIFGCLTTSACVVLLNGAAYGQTWTGADSSADCTWTNTGNWTPAEAPGLCDEVIISDAVPCSTVYVDGGVVEPENLHIGHGMTIHLNFDPTQSGLIVQGMMFIIGAVVFDGPSGLSIEALGLRLGELSSLSGTVLTNETTFSPLEAGGPVGDDCS